MSTIEYEEVRRTSATLKPVRSANILISDEFVEEADGELERNSMLTIIFGAGASHDSAPINSSDEAKRNEWKPPLTKDLFLPEKIWFRSYQLPDQLIPIIEKIRRDTKQNTLEHALEKLKEEVDTNPSRWEQVLAIQDWLYKVLNECSDQWSRALSRSTTYVDMFSRLYDWQIQANKAISIITFNYDTLIEQAASLSFRKEIGINDFDSYMSDKLQVYKPHGSTNWHWEIPVIRDRVRLQDRPLLENEKEHQILWFGSKGLNKYAREGKEFFSIPAIAIPVISKSNSDFIFPPGHHEKMLTALDSTEAIMVIGWAGAEEHFMTELSKRVKKDVPVLVVCGGGGNQTVERLHNLAGLRKVVNAAVTFSGFLDNTRLENWLNDLGKD